MTEDGHYCSCGAALRAGESVCSQCLLAAGLAKSTIAPAGTEQVTLPPTLPPKSSAARVQTSQDEGDVVAGYCDLEALHDWSGGTVFKAFHRGLERRARLCVLETSADSETRRDFLNRAEKLSQINHPNTVSILEAGEHAGSAFVAEELVDGAPLGGFLPRSWRERWREGFFPGDALTRAMRDAASGLHAIHEAGLIHGHLNPDSLLLDRHSHVRVIGLETAAETSDDRFASPTESPANKTVATDIHRLGAIFFFLTTGILPGEADPALRRETLTARMRKLNGGLRRDFCELVVRCLDPISCPYKSANELAEDLNRLLEKRFSKASGRARIYSLLLESFLLLVATSVIVMLLRDRLENDLTSYAMLPLFVLMIYVALCETLLGWTPVRRLFGFRLVNHAGDRISWWRRLARVGMKFSILSLLFLMPALVVPLASRLGMHFAVLLVVIPLSAVSPLILIYLASHWIPSHWAFYDLLAGVTWAEESKVVLDPLVANPADEGSKQHDSVVDRIDQYDIYEPLGEGGMGQVFRAHDRTLHRDVAIKTLVGQLMDDPVLLERFQREARLAAKVSHNNVAKVFGTGLWNDTPYIAMELVQGRNLQETVRDQGPLPITVAWAYIISAAEALSAADRSGVVHRDIKPANLMVTPDGQLKVTDFGVSRQIKVDYSVTEVGTIVGTPAYMAPEQAMGKDVDCRCDIYALGMTLYHMLTGRPPFRGSNVVEILAQQMEENPPSLTDQVNDLTAAQNAVFLKMIAKKPDQRYASYDALLADLRQFAPGADRFASPTKRIAAEACNFAGAYLIFTMMLASFFLLGRNLGITDDNGTQVVGWSMAACFSAFVGMYLFMIGRYGETPGKRLLGLQVARADGQPVGFLRSAVRFAVAFPLPTIFFPIMLYGVIAHVPIPFFRYINLIAMSGQVICLVASILLLWLHPQRRAVHDLAAGTVVVRRAS
jgi:serine/threonine protein kinase